MILHSLINFILFQAVWFIALLFERDSLLPNLLLIVLMIYLSKQKKQDGLLVVIGLTIALSFEYVMVQLGLLTFKVAPFPLWLALLWCGLLLCLNTSMQFLNRLPWYFSILLCAMFAPASYLAAARFEVLIVPLPAWQFWLIYGLAWSVMFNGIMQLNHKISAYLTRTI
ncbi:MAG: DUF2878 domain-containing protein [Pseudoalteromonas sp.]|uniref:DUF2878 domain-containing protein n=1 Tax=unclassified Pseudoalteromonas TaxID=194690 RepID=UPI003F9ACAD8